MLGKEPFNSSRKFYLLAENTATLTSILLTRPSVFD